MVERAPRVPPPTPSGESIAAPQPHTHYSLDLNKYLRKWIPLSVLIGTAGGLGGMALQYAIFAVAAVSYSVAGIPWYLVLLSPVVGAFAAGLIMNRYTPETAGQGMSCVIDALNYRGGKVKARNAPVKLAVTALTVGSGGSGGREGPVALICSGIANFLSARLKLRREDLKILVICSIAAGTTAVFRAPIGGAIFALELPYKNDLEGRAIVPASLSSVASYLVYLPLNSTSPVFSVPITQTTFGFESIPFFLLIGALAGGAGICFVALQRFIRSRFRQAKIPLYAKTALGGLMVGILGVFVPQVLGLGLNVIQSILVGGFAATFLLLLLPLKIAATSLTIGSYGSGGVFSTSLMGGACVGALVATAFSLHPAPIYIAAGMGAMVAGTTKTPIGAAIITSEMVGGYHLFIPLVIASMVGYVATGNFAMYENQTTRGWMPVTMDDLNKIRVKDLMVRSMVSLQARDTIGHALTIAEVEPQEYYPVLDGGTVKGVVDRDEMLEGPATAALSTKMRTEFLLVDPNLTAKEALDLMTERGVPQAVAIEKNRVQGLLSFEEVLGVLGNICSPLDITRKPMTSSEGNGPPDDTLK